MTALRGLRGHGGDSAVDSSFGDIQFLGETRVDDLVLPSVLLHDVIGLQIPMDAVPMQLLDRIKNTAIRLMIWLTMRTASSS